MEYSPLAWSSCPPSYLGLLDRVQARAQRLARLKAPEAAAQIIQPLQQRRDVAGMCVMYKAHKMQLLQLAELRLNPRARPSHSTRAAHNIDHQVTVPFARTEHYLRSFLPRYGRLWNTLVRQTDLHLTTSLHAFKSGPPTATSCRAAWAHHTPPATPPRHHATTPPRQRGPSPIAATATRRACSPPISAHPHTPSCGLCPTPCHPALPTPPLPPPLPPPLAPPLPPPLVLPLAAVTVTSAISRHA
ncbi:hypothetical protein GWK47_005430 [Chionoecetes opilio]|uniref:Uncharacterized protein n=1 Tax=Chionoecetes opilio TaxID=41210 RepID=A0A8J4YBL3_CHIOP|nr:hypothetical protein GWK47_005430 [Chionoecetes opilio]